MNLTTFQSREEAKAAAGEYLNELFKQSENKPLLFLASGGSALEVLDYIGSSSLSENITIIMADERFSEKAEENNFLQMQKTDFYVLAEENNVNFIGSLPRPGENIFDLRSRLELAILNWIKENREGKIAALFGMGADGHTAGIFPFTENPKEFTKLFENQQILTAYDAGEKTQFPKRITTTPAFFQKIDEAVLFACGNDKKEKIKEFLKGDGQPHELPALLLYKCKNLSVFTDIKP